MTEATQFLVDTKGEKVAAVIPIEEYEALIEDLHDLAIVAERRSEPKVSMEEVRKNLRENGLLPD